MVLVWIRDEDGRVQATALCLPHLAALTFPPAVAA